MRKNLNNVLFGTNPNKSLSAKKNKNNEIAYDRWPKKTNITLDNIAPKYPKKLLIYGFSETLLNPGSAIS